MERISKGMTVRSLDDYTVGVVSNVKRCCFRIELTDGRTSLSITPEGIFDVQPGLVSLIYVATEGHRYCCAAHPRAVRVAPSANRTWSAPRRERVPLRFAGGRTALDERVGAGNRVAG